MQTACQLLSDPVSQHCCAVFGYLMARDVVSRVEEDPKTRLKNIVK